MPEQCPTQSNDSGLLAAFFFSPIDALHAKPAVGDSRFRRFQKLAQTIGIGLFFLLGAYVAAGGLIEEWWTARLLQSSGKDATAIVKTQSSYQRSSRRSSPRTVHRHQIDFDGRLATVELDQPLGWNARVHVRYLPNEPDVFVLGSQTSVFETMQRRMRTTVGSIRFMGGLAVFAATIGALLCWRGVNDMRAGLGS